MNKIDNVIFSACAKIKGKKKLSTFEFPLFLKFYINNYINVIKIYNIYS